MSESASPRADRAVALRAAMEKVEPAVSWYWATSTTPFQASRSVVDSQALRIIYEAAEAQLKILEEGK